MIFLLLFFSSFSSQPKAGAKEFKNKKVIITGGTRGIGFAAAKLFIKEEATVVITGRDETAGVEAAQELGCEFFQMDVGEEESWEKLLKKHSQWDILFNNAGLLKGEEGIENLDPETFLKVYMTNVLGVMLGCKYAIKAMKDKEGVIINNASVGGLNAFPFMEGIYASSKAAVINFTKSVAIDCWKRKYKIRANSLVPGFIKTDMLDMSLGGNRRYLGRVIKLVCGKWLAHALPPGRFARPEEVAECVLFLASSRASYINGQELIVDGGMSSLLFRV